MVLTWIMTGRADVSLRDVDLQYGHIAGHCQNDLGGWRVRLVGQWLTGEVKIVARTLVGATLAYVEGPDAGGEDWEVGLLKSRAIVESGRVLK